MRTRTCLNWEAKAWRTLCAQERQGTETQDASTCSGGPDGPRSAHSPCPPSAADITGPIILQTYRAIADYEKTSGSEMALAMGDVVEVVEKSESGQTSRPTGLLPLVLRNPQPQAPCQGSDSLAPGRTLAPLRTLNVLPTLRVALSECAPCSGCGHLCMAGRGGACLGGYGTVCSL